MQPMAVPNRAESFAKRWPVHSSEHASMRSREKKFRGEYHGREDFGPQRWQIHPRATTSQSDLESAAAPLNDHLPPPPAVPLDPPLLSKRREVAAGAPPAPAILPAMSTKRKLPQKLGQPVVKQPAKVLGKGNVDESRTVVSSGGYAVKPNINGKQEIVDISSDSSSEEEQEEEEDEEEGSAEDDEDSVAGGDVDMEDAESTAEARMPDDTEETGEPSFGDLIRANATEPIDVAGAFEDPSFHVATFPKGTQIQPPSGASLGTVLTQALRTNDIALLESCLHTTDVGTIRATIQRLESSLAGILLQKLADRLHRRPGRAGSLMVWVQWTLVTHGGYLATQPDLIKKLAELNKVIDERAKALQNLLSLKGKLDMLEAQIELRRNIQDQRKRLEEDEDDDGVIYVEGEESEEETAVPKPQRLTRNGDLEGISDGESDISEDMPMTNGVIADEDDEEGDSSEEDELIDDEAEETDADTGDEDEVDHEDQDSQGEDDESDDGLQAAPPTKMAKTGGLFSKKR